MIYTNVFTPYVQYLRPAELGKLVAAMMAYHTTGEVPSFHGQLAMAWGVLQTYMDRDRERYLQKVEGSRYAAYCREQKKAGKTPLDRTDWLLLEERMTSDDIKRYPDTEKTITSNTKTDSETEAETIKNTETKLPPRERAAEFTPPTEEEVRAYCDERGNSVDAARFVNFYTASGWVQGKGKPILDWKACVRSWEGIEQHARPSAPAVSAIAPAPAPPSSGKALEQYERLERLRREMTGEASALCE